MRRKKMPSLLERKEAMEKRLKAKKEKVLAKLKGSRPGDAIIELVAMLAAAAFVLAVMGLCCCGCALERSDPAARSNRATITLSVIAHGDNSMATGYITDGLLATADGEGAITQPSTQTAEQSPDLTVPGDALSAGITAAAHIGGKAIDAYSASKAASADGGGEPQTANSKLPTSPASCPGGNCEVK